jgi:hypothetical protein
MASWYFLTNLLSFMFKMMRVSSGLAPPWLAFEFMYLPKMLLMSSTVWLLDNEYFRSLAKRAPSECYLKVNINRRRDWVIGTTRVVNTFER